MLSQRHTLLYNVLKRGNTVRVLKQVGKIVFVDKKFATQIIDRVDLRVMLVHKMLDVRVGLFIFGSLFHALGQPKHAGNNYT